MSRKKSNSQILRLLAEGLVERIAEEEDLPLDVREDLATSLVRQWITYGGHATIFVEGRQFYLNLGHTPLGKPVVYPEPAGAGWVKQLVKEWKISSDQLPNVFEQINRGQSAETVNEEGIRLRLWVNPSERSKGVEPIDPQKRPPKSERNYHKIAADTLEQELDEAVDPRELEVLAHSVASQWKRFQGHACIFLDPFEQIWLKASEQPEGICHVQAVHKSVNLEQSLTTHGFPLEAVPEIIVRFNLAQKIEFEDDKGNRRRLWHDPKARQIVVERVDAKKSGQSKGVPPVFCPKCTATLKPWRQGERQQTCSLCGYVITAGF